MAKRLLMGNELFAHAALEAGVSIVAGYPGTPATEVVETAARQRAKGRAQGVYVEWSDNEKAALEVCVAASMSGKRAMLACNSEGIAVAASAVVASSSINLRGGLVLLVADDPGPTSSQTEHDTRAFAQFAHIPVFDPATPEQGYEMTKQAFDLSEAYSVPVVVRPTTRICHESLFLDVEEQTQARPPQAALDGFAGFTSDGSKGFVADAQRWVLLPQGMGGTSLDAVERTKKIAHAFAYDKAFEGFNPIYLNGIKATAGSVAASERNNPRNSRFASDSESSSEVTAKLGIACGGCSTEYALEALEILKREAKRAGLNMPDYKLIQIGTPYPFPRRAVTRFFKDLSDVLVIEELDAFLENEMLKLSGTALLSPRIHGKLTGEAQANGENSTEGIAKRIAAFFDEYSSEEDETQKHSDADDSSYASNSEADDVIDEYDDDEYDDDEYDDFDDEYDEYDEFDEEDVEDAGDDAQAEEETLGVQNRRNSIAKRLAARQKKITLSNLVDEMFGADALYSYDKDLPERTPTLCAGCPHRASFIAVKSAIEHLDIPRSSIIFSGDLGCQMLGASEPLNALDTCLCMGGGISMAQGFSVVDPNRKTIAFVGDSAFFAAGMTGVANAVSNNHDITVIVLDNSATAMTGLQPNPGTSVSLSAGRTPAIGVEHVLRALGMDEVHTVDPLDRAASEDACVSALQVEGPSAVVMKSPCIWLKQSDDVAVVNVHKCTGCKRCIVELGCPAISFDLSARGAKSGRRGQAVIDLAQCNGCSLCVQICPFQGIEIFRRDEMSLMDAFQKPASKSARHAMIATHVDETLTDDQPSSDNSAEEIADVSEEPIAAVKEKEASFGLEPETLLKAFGFKGRHAAQSKQDMEEEQAQEQPAEEPSEAPDFIVEVEDEEPIQHQMELFNDIDLDPFEGEEIESLEDFDASTSQNIPINVPEVVPQYSAPVPQPMLAPNVPYPMNVPIQGAPIGYAPYGMPPAGMYPQFDAYGRPIAYGYIRPQMPMPQPMPMPQQMPMENDESANSQGLPVQGPEADEVDKLSDAPTLMFDSEDAPIDESLYEYGLFEDIPDEEPYEEPHEAPHEATAASEIAIELLGEEKPPKPEPKKTEVTLDSLFASGVHIDLGGDA